MGKLFLNSVLIYTLLLALMRLTGKRQLGELELSELVVTILISEVASLPMTEPDTPLWMVLIPILTMTGLEYLLSVLAMRSIRFRAILAGKPAILVAHGRIDQGQMRKNRMTPDELMEALRSDGVLDIASVEYAVLETNGRLSVIQKPETGRACYPVTVIDNGRVLSENLRLLGRDENWLRKILREQGAGAPEGIYMMTADAAGTLFIAEKETQP